ncbi:MAG: type II toxin-antitoxin system HicA family toxin [Ignavibacteriaceae bacterium]|nr:type II toxin-antitoxin system HicA family toxin [Ignavibacteriaceae bacterium]
MKIKEIIKLIEADGWYLDRQKGSHKQYKHPEKKGIVTISMHKLSDEVAQGTLGSILKQAKLDKIRGKK